MITICPILVSFCILSQTKNQPDRRMQVIAEVVQNILCLEQSPKIFSSGKKNYEKKDQIEKDQIFN